MSQQAANPADTASFASADPTLITDSKTLGADTASKAPTTTDDTPAESSNPEKSSWKRRLSSMFSKKHNDEKRPSMSESGPMIFAFDPNTGKEVLQKNPHWPNEDSWKREEENKGQWAFGSMAGQQNKDFGGQVG